MISPRRPSLLTTSTAATIAVAAMVTLGPGRQGGHLVRADDTFNGNLTDAIVFTGTQLEVLSEEVLVELGTFTDYTDTDGLWITVKDSGDTVDQTVWTSGMVAGMFWYQYALTGEEVWKTRAEFFLEGLEGVEETDDNDLGFQVFDSFGLGYKLITNATEKAAYKERVLTGANTLHDLRWDADIPAFWSWDDLSRRPEWERAVNIDMMMNMEILLWASEYGESVADAYATKVEAHANQTWIDIVRVDNSTYHAADYDPETGELVDQGTYQGYTDESTWTRGQAWGIYGMVMVYRFREKPHFLSYSIGLLEYWEANIPDDLVPPADFDAPDDDDNGKDSSASAIVASALFEIFTYTEDANYLLRAQEYLTAIMSPDSDYFQPDATDGYQSILRRATSRWSEPETGAVFGDYFFLEALWRYKTLAPSVLLLDEDEVTVNGASSSSGKAAGFGGRRQLSLRGGKYCELVYVDNKLQLKDPDCVPEPPNFGDGSTPSPVAAGSTASPTSEMDDSSSATPSPVTISTAEPISPTEPITPTETITLTEAIAPTTETIAPTTESPSLTLPPSSLLPSNAPESAAPTPPPSASVGTPSPVSGDTVSKKIVFTGSDLDNDVTFALLNTIKDVYFWFAVTLSNTANIPSSITLESDSGATVEATVASPDGGWVAGLNKVHFTITTRAMATGSWDKIGSVTVKFETSATSGGEDTDVVVEWLVVTNELFL